MPELPEVETVRRGLEPVMAGRRVLKATLRRPDLRFPLPPRFAARLKGARIERLARRGKYLLAPLGTGETLVMHLGMSGRFTITGAQGDAHAPGDFRHARAVDPAHDHVVFALEGGASVTYNDPRRFGFMDLVPAKGLPASPHFARMGPEPLEAAFDGARLAAALAGRRAPLKALLLDQRVVAGLGNIYVAEALHRARLSPSRPGGALSAREADTLADAIKAVLADAIAAGGSSLRDYADAQGGLGYFQHAFAVYDREGEPCPRLRCRGVIARSVQSGRASYACTACQT